MIKEVFLASTIATASMTLAMSAHAQSMPQPQDRAPALSVQAPDARAIDGQSLLGLDVFSQDQNRVGSVEKVVNGARGEVHRALTLLRTNNCYGIVPDFCQFQSCFIDKCGPLQCSQSPAAGSVVGAGTRGSD